MAHQRFRARPRWRTPPTSDPEVPRMHTNTGYAFAVWTNEEPAPTGPGDEGVNVRERPGHARPPTLAVRHAVSAQERRLHAPTRSMGTSRAKGGAASGSGLLLSPATPSPTARAHGPPWACTPRTLPRPPPGWGAPSRPRWSHGRQGLVRGSNAVPCIQRAKTESWRLALQSWFTGNARLIKPVAS